MEKNSNPKDQKNPETESPKISPLTESEDHSHKTRTSQEQAKAISELEGLRTRIEECPSERVREALKDSLNKENNWKTDNPFSLTKAKLKRVNGNVSKILPPTANITAKKIRINIVNNLTLFDIFFVNTVLHHFIKKYKIVKIISV